MSLRENQQSPPRELILKRDRLIERFTALQLDLGGAYYEMAIRDHIRDDVLLAKAAELQQVEAELKAVEAVLHETATSCPACGATVSRGAPNCWQCATKIP